MLPCKHLQRLGDPGGLPEDQRLGDLFRQGSGEEKRESGMRSELGFAAPSQLVLEVG
jgi:hypothetical protein